MGSNIKPGENPGQDQNTKSQCYPPQVNSASSEFGKNSGNSPTNDKPTTSNVAKGNKQIEQPQPQPGTSGSRNWKVMGSSADASRLAGSALIAIDDLASHSPMIPSLTRMSQTRRMALVSCQKQLASAQRIVMVTMGIEAGAFFVFYICVMIADPDLSSFCNENFHAIVGFMVLIAFSILQGGFLDHGIDQQSAKAHRVYPDWSCACVQIILGVKLVIYFFISYFLATFWFGLVISIGAILLYLPEFYMMPKLKRSTQKLPDKVITRITNNY